MDSVQNWESYINTPSSQTDRSYENKDEFIGGFLWSQLFRFDFII
jgi:hypothetical protein